MNNFDFYNPTKVIFGKDTLVKLGEEVKKFTPKCVMVLYGGKYLEENGVLKNIEENLNKEGISSIYYGDVYPNPLVSSIYNLKNIAEKNEVDFILAVGGGSVIDTAKALGIVLENPTIDLVDLIMKRSPIKSCTPIGVVSTIAGSGSESSSLLVLTIDEGMLKRSYGNDLIRPIFAIMDPEMTYTLPKYQMISGAFDIIMHTMDRYFSLTKNTDLIDSISEGLMRTVIDAIKISFNNQLDYEARATLMWAGSLSHNGLTGTGRVEDWACHRLEHELSGMFDAVHGAGLCAIWGSWAKYVYKENPKRFACFARNVMNINRENISEEELALLGINELVDMFKFCGMPISITELGYPNITDEDLSTMTKNCLLTSESIGSFKQLYYDDILTIYKNAR